MPTKETVSHCEAEDAGDCVKVTIDIPASIWKEAKKAAIDKGVTGKQYVADVLAEHLGLKAA